MRKRKLKKGLAWILACALFMGMTPVNTQAKEQKNSEIALLTANVTLGGSATGGAATIEPTAEPKEIVIGDLQILTDAFVVKKLLR